MEEKTKRTAILEAAALVFAKHGYHDAKVEEIALAAGVGKGTVYGYFASKQQLFLQTIMNGLEVSIQEANVQLDGCQGGITKLKRMVQIHCHNLFKYSNLTRVTMEGQAQLTQEVREKALQIEEQRKAILKSVILEGIKSGEFRADLDVEAATVTVMGALKALFQMAVWQENIREETVSHLAERVVDVIIKGMQ